MLWKIALLVAAGLCIFVVWLEEAGIQYLIVHIEPSRELKALDIVTDNVIKKSTGSQDTAVLLLRTLSS